MITAVVLLAAGLTLGTAISALVRTGHSRVAMAVAGVVCLLVLMPPGGWPA